jgi:tRNA dimethylallyltransferase
LWIGIAPEKNILHEKITARLHARMRRGMVAEARRLHAEGLSFKRMESFGLEYRSLARFLQGKTTSAEMYEQLDRDIRHYAKRQLSYWKRNTNITWFKPSEERGIERTVRSWLVR